MKLLEAEVGVASVGVDRVRVIQLVQASADRVGILREGKLVAVEAVDVLRRRAVRRVEVHFDAPVAPEPFCDLPDVSDVRVEGSVLRCRLAGRADPLVKAVARYGVASLTVEEPDLEEIFFAYYGGEEAHDAA